MDFKSATASGARAPVPGDVPGPAQLELSARSRELLEILGEFKGNARVLYEGAVRVVADGANPGRIRLGAHALRELMDELEGEAGLTRQGPSLKERVRKLQDEWKVAERSFEIGSDGRGTGFTQTLAEFFVAFEADYPRRRDQASAALAELDPAKRAPPAVRHARAKARMGYRDYFVGVAHGSIPPDAEFRSRFEGFETFLLDWLRPRTFADLDAIDELLLKGPPDG